MANDVTTQLRLTRLVCDLIGIRSSGAPVCMQWALALGWRKCFASAQNVCVNAVVTFGRLTTAHCRPCARFWASGGSGCRTRRRSAFRPRPSSSCAFGEHAGILEMMEWSMCYAVLDLRVEDTARNTTGSGFGIHLYMFVADPTWNDALNRRAVCIVCYETRPEASEALKFPGRPQVGQAQQALVKGSPPSQ